MRTRRFHQHETSSDRVGRPRGRASSHARPPRPRVASRSVFRSAHLSPASPIYSTWPPGVKRWQKSSTIDFNSTFCPPGDRVKFSPSGNVSGIRSSSRGGSVPRLQSRQDRRSRHPGQGRSRQCHADGLLRAPRGLNLVVPLRRVDWAFRFVGVLNNEMRLGELMKGQPAHRLPSVGRVVLPVGIPNEVHDRACSEHWVRSITPFRLRVETQQREEHQCRSFVASLRIHPQTFENDPQRLRPARRLDSRSNPIQDQSVDFVLASMSMPSQVAERVTGRKPKGP